MKLLAVQFREEAEKYTCVFQLPQQSILNLLDFQSGDEHMVKQLLGSVGLGSRSGSFSRT
jgi:hypothetical protein